MFYWESMTVYRREVKSDADSKNRARNPEAFEPTVEEDYLYKIKSRPPQSNPTQCEVFRRDQCGKFPKISSMKVA